MPKTSVKPDLECMFRTATGRLAAAKELGHREFVLTRLYEST